MGSILNADALHPRSQAGRRVVRRVLWWAHSLDRQPLRPKHPSIHSEMHCALCTWQAAVFKVQPGFSCAPAGKADAVREEAPVMFQVKSNCKAFESLHSAAVQDASLLC